MKHGLVTSTMLVAAAVLALAGGAQRAHAQQGTGEKLAEYTAAARERLGLTDEQVEQIRPLMEERNRRFAEIRERHAGDDSRAAKRAMMKEARAAQTDYEAAVEPLLTEEQVTEWRAMQKEMRAEFKERRRAAQTAEGESPTTPTP
ncbi:MAG TPA: hypothetical protein VFY03_01665 [Woeseiaceae bacterium]|nr:hypothetical protein [Woeseiaceae bacterium]